MTPARAQIIRTVECYRPLVQRVLTEPPFVGHGLEVELVLAMICQESSGNPFAVRVERGFFRRYGAGLLALVRRTSSGADDFWIGYPDFFSASYGLMQVMYPVALECGIEPRFPTELCDPELGIRAGLARLQKAMARRGAEWRAVLLDYNGGGDPSYPARIFAWREDIVSLRSGGEGVI